MTDPFPLTQGDAGGSIYRPKPVKIADQLEIDEVIDCRTGDLKEAREVLTLTDESFSQLRVAVHEARAQGDSLLLCAHCLEPIYPAEEVKKVNRGAHFRHFHGDGDCPARTRDNLSVEAKLARQFNGAKEGWEHRDTKRKLVQSLWVDSRFSETSDERRWWSANHVRWRQPDVQTSFNGKRVAFEIQLARTYASVIAARRVFYREQGGIVVWVFRDFATAERLLAVDDLFHTNNRNALLVNEKTLTESIRSACFKLECHWPEPDESDKSQERWHSEMIAFSQLELDWERQRAWFFDCEGARAIALQAKEKEVVATLRETLKQFVATAKTKEWAERVPLWDSARALAATIDLSLPATANEADLERLLAYLFSAEEGRPIGFAFQKLVQVAFNADDCHPALIKPLGWALKHYGRLQQLSAESTKWSARQNQIRAAMQCKVPKYSQDQTWYPLIARLFPELKSYIAES